MMLRFNLEFEPLRYVLMTPAACTLRQGNEQNCELNDKWLWMQPQWAEGSC